MALKIKRKRKVTRTKKISNMREYEVFYGKEPTWFDDYENDENWKLDMRRALQWYNLAPLKNIDKKKWLIEFLQKNDYQEFSEDFIKQIKQVPENYLPVASAVARMLSRGATFSENDYQSFLDILNRSTNSQVEEVSTETKTPARKKPDVQQAIKIQIAEHIGEVENQLVDFTTNGYSSKFSMYEYLNINDVKGMIAGKVKLYFLDEYNSFCDVVNEDDDYLVEAYSHMTVTERDKYLQFLGQIVDDLTIHIQNCSNDKTKKPKKERTKKEKSPETLASKIKYQEEDVDLKLKSVRPEKIIGAEEVWTYHTRLRALTVYRSNSVDGLSLAGSTLKGYDESKSMKKSLRKPEEFFTKVVGNTKKQLAKELESLKMKELPIGSRINNETILLRVY